MEMRFYAVRVRMWDKMERRAERVKRDGVGEAGGEVEGSLPAYLSFAPR